MPASKRTGHKQFDYDNFFNYYECWYDLTYLNFQRYLHLYPGFPWLMNQATKKFLG